MRYRSKTLASWIAVGGGLLGLHRFYLYGGRDRLAWLYPLPALAGLLGLLRLRSLGQDDPLSWLLLPLAGCAFTAAMLTAIVYGLTPDARWDARHNPGLAPRATRWGPVLAAMLALLLGGIVSMATLAFGLQKLFEWLSGPLPG